MSEKRKKERFFSSFKARKGPRSQIFQRKIVFSIKIGNFQKRNSVVAQKGQIFQKENVHSQRWKKVNFFKEK